MDWNRQSATGLKAAKDLEGVRRGRWSILGLILAPTDLQPGFVFLRKFIFGFKCITLLCFLTMTTCRMRYATFTLIHFRFKYKGAYRMSVNISLDTAPSRCAVLLLLLSRLGDQHDHLTVLISDVYQTLHTPCQYIKKKMVN